MGNLRKFVPLFLFVIALAAVFTLDPAALELVFKMQPWSLIFLLLIAVLVLFCIGLVIRRFALEIGAKMSIRESLGLASVLVFVDNLTMQALPGGEIAVSLAIARKNAISLPVALSVGAGLVISWFAGYLALGALYLFFIRPNLPVALVVFAFLAVVFLLRKMIYAHLMAPIRTRLASTEKIRVFESSLGKLLKPEVFAYAVALQVVMELLSAAGFLAITLNFGQPASQAVEAYFIPFLAGPFAFIPLSFEALMGSSIMHSGGSFAFAAVATAYFRVFFYWLFNVLGFMALTERVHLATVIRKS